MLENGFQKHACICHSQVFELSPFRTSLKEILMKFFFECFCFFDLIIYQMILLHDNYCEIKMVGFETHEFFVSRRRGPSTQGSLLDSSPRWPLLLGNRTLVSEGCQKQELKGEAGEAGETTSWGISNNMMLQSHFSCCLIRATRALRSSPMQNILVQGLSRH